VIPGAEEDNQIEVAVILQSGSAASAAVLRGFCAEHLPWYAVPATVSVLPSFPRTTSGKVDRKALQTAARERLALEVRV
ncbi:MAG: hypothetical protein WBG92_18410, partial [Thiohalocapsa sp.]